MEVHPPHQPLHSWKDFWIHLGTITIGLLIAISLEQSVEKLHHLHQRHQLEEQLRGEGERNIAIVEYDQRYFAALRTWELCLRRNVDANRASGGKAKLPYLPDLVPRSPTVPSDSVWMTAKESQLTVLLPPSEAAMYARLELQHRFLQDAVDRWLLTKTEVEAFENNFDDAEHGSLPDLGRMNSDQLSAYSMLLTKDVTVRDDVVYRLKMFLALDEAVLHGAKTEVEMVTYAQANLNKDAPRR
jgi:hypothetical protein